MSSSGGAGADGLGVGRAAASRGIPLSLAQGRLDAALRRAQSLVRGDQLMVKQGSRGSISPPGTQ